MKSLLALLLTVSATYALPPFIGVDRITPAAAPAERWFYWTPTNQTVDFGGGAVTYPAYLATVVDADVTNVTSTGSSITHFYTSATNLTTLAINGTSTLVVVSATNLTTCLSFDFQLNTALTNLSLPKFCCNDFFDVSGCSSLTNISLPMFDSTYSFNCNSTPITSLSLATATSLGDLFFHECSSLTSVNVGSANFDANVDCTIWGYNCALDVTSVNNLLIQINYDGPLGGDVIRLEGGSNATPTGDGWTAYQALTNANNSVTINF